MNLSPDMAEAFANARPQAQHCDALIKTGPRPEERAEYLASWRRDIARELAQDLSELLSGARLSVSLTDPETVPGAEVFSRIGPIAANSLLRCGKDDHTLLLSFSYATATALTDRSFGGDGKPPENSPEQLPRSAGMLTDQAAKIVAQAIARVSLGAEQGTSDGAVRSLRADVIVRSESASRLKPFEHETPCALFILDVSEESGSGDLLSWKALLAMSVERLDMLLPGSANANSGGKADAKPNGPKDAPFAAIPLALEAVLADLDMPLSKLERIAPGDHIPLAMPREVPLRMGEDVFAHGTLGTRENRMALRLTRVAGGEVPA